MSKKVQMFILGILCIAPIIVFAALYNQLPNEVPLQFAFSGDVNRYGEKSELITLALMPLFVVLLMKVSRKIDPKKANYDQFSGFYEAFIYVIAVFFNVVFGFVLYLTFYPGTWNIGLYIMIGVGLLFMFIGAYLPRAKQNFFFGIKTPWTLSSEDVWNKTHKLGGICFLISGVIMAFSSFLPEDYMVAVILVAVLVAAAIPCVMSYIYYKKEENAV